jgi:predicted dehydrogenase
MNNTARETKPLTIGMIGAGAFARFAAGAFLQTPGIRIAAITDLNKMAARQLSAEQGSTVYDSVDDLLADANIRLVYIATPPFLHYAQSKACLLAGKHVICEKPAALRTREAEELAGLARSKGLVYAVNLIQRYNPLFGKIKTIIEEKILGNFLHGFFENYASDEHLDPGHWFWDRSRSGGIFIEHGVHFFDLFAGWLGEGKVAGAWQWKRSDTHGAPIDRVQATIMYSAGIVNFYHGFNQPDLLDRQEMRLQFEWGELSLSEWVPVGMRLHGLLQDGRLDRLLEIIGDCRVIHHPDFAGHITLEYAHSSGKKGLYREMLGAMISDQRRRIDNPGHVPVIDDHNAIRSLRVAEEAQFIADKACSASRKNNEHA